MSETFTDKDKKRLMELRKKIATLRDMADHELTHDEIFTLEEKNEWRQLNSKEFQIAYEEIVVRQKNQASQTQET